jgi:dihydroflavonol-4-reductase|tara:strand:+ start:165 stop:1175 length:1011 start_codon:yes stop_codon:yes gene_type:complete
LEKVLVTGGSGYIALHCIAELLKNGFYVRTSLRTIDRKKEVVNSLQKVVNPKDMLEFCILDLMEDKGWDKAVQGCTYVMHIASPVLSKGDDENKELIQPAVQGISRAIHSSVKHKVKRFIMTSSVAAICQGYEKKIYDENDWTDLNSNTITNYDISKTKAERYLWSFIKDLNNNEKIEVCTINPSFVVGPSLSNDIGSSNIVIKILLNSLMPFIPRLNLGFVDVRDVAKIHIKAMLSENAAGKRFILNERTMWLSDLSKLLNQNGFKAPKYIAPNIFIKLLALFVPEVGRIVNRLDIIKNLNSNQSKVTLDWQPSNIEKSILDAATQIKNLDVLNK